MGDGCLPTPLGVAGGTAAQTPTELGTICKVPCTPLPTGSQKDECETRAIEDCTKPVGLVHRIERNNRVWSTLEQAPCQLAP